MIGDVCLLGSCLDEGMLYKNAHKLIGSQGVIQGKLFIFHCDNDNILSYLFAVARIGEVAIGKRAMDVNKIAEMLKMYDSGFVKENISNVVRYVNNKVEFIDVSDMVTGHLDYREKMFELLKMTDFGNDERSSMVTSFF